MTSYPITIEAETIDLSAVLEQGSQKTVDRVVGHELDKVYANSTDFEMASTLTTSITKNNLTDFKKYLDNKDSEIHEYIGENGIVYSYNTKFGIYTHDPEGEFVNTDGSTLSSRKESGGMFSMAGMEEMKNNMLSNFTELLPNSSGKGISEAVKESYDVLYGDWPVNKDEVILVLDRNNEIPSSTLYQLGILPSKEYKEMLEKIEKGEKVEPKENNWSYEEICSKEFYMIPDCDTYEKTSKGNFLCFADDIKKMEELMEKALKLKIVGVVKPIPNAKAAILTSAICYTKELSDYVIEKSNASQVVKAQQNSKDINVLNNMTFSPSDDKVKIKDAKKYLSNLGVTEKAQMCKVFINAMSATNPQMAAQAAYMSETDLAMALDNYLINPEDSVLLQIYDSYISSGSYDENMSKFGVVNRDAPSAINIYTDSFENKDMVSECISRYNERAEEENKISYTDYVGILMSSVTTIINIISYVLIAFVSVSLIVSSIMIGIITYISVLERTKEIGILRAIGASKRNISQVFSAETFIIGLCSGILGISVSALVLIPANMIIHTLTGVDTINAVLPPVAAAILVVLSVILTLIGGIIPSKKAAKKDPVTALRSE
jgi:putative ABC transport system permease protein